MAASGNRKLPLNYVYKIILLGEYNVGKSSLFCRFKDDTFKEHQNASVSIDNFSKCVAVNGKGVTLILWDTVGTERFRTLTRNYFRNAHACLFVYSISEPESLLGLTQWVEDAENFAEPALKVLIGNKNDCHSRVNQQKVEEFAHYHNCDIIFQVSAKTGNGVHEMFYTVAEKLLARDNKASQNTQKLFEDYHNKDDVHSLHEETQQQSTCC